VDIGVNAAVLPWDHDFAELPKLLTLVGTSLVEFPVQLWQVRGGGESLVGALRVASVSGLVRRSDVLPESLLAPRDVWEREAASLVRRVAAAHAVASPAVSLSIPPWTDQPEAVSRPLFLDRLRRCADVASASGLSVNLEFVSPIVARNSGDRQPFAFCRSLDAARELIAAADRPCIRLLLDFLHWSADPRAADPAVLAPEVGLVHLCDHADAQPRMLSDITRLVPFEGRLKLRDFVAALIRGGYDGPAVIEVFYDARRGPSIARTAASVQELVALGAEHAARS